MACRPTLGLQDAAFSIVYLKVQLVDLLLFCIVDGSVLQETKVLLIDLSVLMKAVWTPPHTHLWGSLMLRAM